MDIKLQPNITGTNVNLVKGATQADLTNAVNNAKTYRDEAQAFSIVSEDKSIESAYSALNASVSATTAIDKAIIATNKATEANNSANSASASETVCIAKATIATDNANIAIAQAIIATNKATEANTSANTANTQANIAITKASEASISAINALTSENNADTSEANALIYRNQAESFANSINPSDLVHISGTETITGNKTFSGTVSGLTKATVGLSNVDNTSDANKPISNAVQTALGLKADKANTLGGYGITDAYTKTSTDSLIDIHSKTEKTTLVDADEFTTADSTTSFSLKKISWASIKTALSSLFISKVTTPTTNALAKIQADGNIKNTGVIVDDSNIVLIGTSTPVTGAKFQVFDGTIRAIWGYIVGGGSYAGTQTNQHYGFITNDIERGRFTNIGNLLVGTTTDDGVNKLQVNGSLKAKQTLIKNDYNCKKLTKLINTDTISGITTGIKIRFLKPSLVDAWMSMRVKYMAYPNKTSLTEVSCFCYQTISETVIGSNTITNNVTPTWGTEVVSGAMTLYLLIPSTSVSYGRIEIEATVGSATGTGDNFADDFIQIYGY